MLFLTLIAVIGVMSAVTSGKVECLVTLIPYLMAIPIELKQKPEDD